MSRPPTPDPRPPLFGAELLIGAIVGRRQNRDTRRQQRQARRSARKTTAPTPIDRAVSAARYYVRKAHFGPGRNPRQAGELKMVNAASYAAALADYKRLRGWDELAALRGQLEYPEVIVYELWDHTSSRPVLRQRWDTTMVDQGLKRQYIAMGL